MGQDYNLRAELEKLIFLNPEAGLPGVPSVKGHPKLHVLVGEALPELTAKVRAVIPPSKYLLHVHAPGAGSDALRASRPEGERTLFLEIVEDDSMLSKFSNFLKTLRPDHADLTVQTTQDPLVQNAIPRIRMAIDLEMPNLSVDRNSALTRLRCSLLNLGLMGSSPLLSAKLLDPALPALVCGAGPSLSAQLDFIKANSSRFLLVACGHAAIKMKEAGLEPDFVVEADPRCRINWSRLKDDVSSPLAALSCVDPAVASRFKRLLWFEGDSPEFNHLCRIAGLPLRRISISRGVIVTALDFAFKVGCSKVALLGCDLALSSDGATHAGSRRADGDELSLLDVDGHEPGSKVRTTLDFNEIRKALEDHLLRSGRRDKVFNCTPSGARIEGIGHITLKNFIDSHCHVSPAAKYEFAEEHLSGDLAGNLQKISGHLAKYIEASKRLSEAARKLHREIGNSVFDQPRFQKARTAFDIAIKEENAMLNADGMTPILVLPKNKADDILDEAPASNLTQKDALGQLRLLSRKTALTASFCSELKDDLDFAISMISKGISSFLTRDPADYKSLREFSSSIISKGNPELGEAIASKRLPPPETAGFSLHLRFEDIPQVSKIMEDGSKTQFSGLLSGTAEAKRLVEEFSKDFDPKIHAPVIVAAGNYGIVETFAISYPDVPCLVLDPWPELFCELACRCAFIHRLPESSTAVVVHDSFRSWRKVLAQAIDGFKRRKLAPRLLLNPKTSSLPEVKVLLELKELKWQ